MSDKHLVDIGVLCEFMDYLCGAMIAAHFMNTRGTLHGVTLPQSWLVRMLREPFTTKSVRADTIKMYLDCIALALEILWTGEGGGEHLI